MPPCTAGWSVFTRPSNSSGKPVSSATSRTLNPASRSAVAVPPVETILTPWRASPCASSRRPVLSETERSARETRIELTAPSGAGSPRHGSPRDHGERFLVAPARLLHDLIRKPGRRRIPVPADRVQIVADHLLVEGVLRHTFLVGRDRPVARGV